MLPVTPDKGRAHRAGQTPRLYRARYLLPIVGAPIEDGALLVEAGRIAALGPYAALRHSTAELHDCGDAILLPPLVNAHCHLELSDFPHWAGECGEGAAPSSFVAWIERLVRIRRRLGSDRNAASIRNGVAALLASGTGAVGDIVSWLPGAAITAATPLHGRLYAETIGLTPERYAPALAAAQRCCAELRGPCSGGLAPHAPYTLSPAHLRAAVASNLPLAIHCAESPEESEFIRSSRGPLAEELYAHAGWAVPTASGLSPVAWLDACGALTPRTLLVHGVQVDSADVALIAARGSSVVLCPRSNRQLGVGTAPAARYRRHGVPLALGTDSLASNDSLSLWDELAIARQVYPEFAPGELLRMATLGGAEALGVTLGRLREGGDAAFQVLQPRQLPGPAELEEFLCSPGRGNEVTGLWLQGRQVYASATESCVEPR